MLFKALHPARSSSLHRAVMRRTSWVTTISLLLTISAQSFVQIRGMAIFSKQKPMKVAVIGGGISGLSCAQALASASSDFDVTVYDTGRLRPGGRCSSRQPGDPAKEDDNQMEYPVLSKFRFDHAAQLIAKPDPEKFPEFAAQVETWLEQGLLQRCPPTSICQITRSGKAIPLPGDQEFYYAKDGMGSLATSIVERSGGSFRLEQDVWVSPSNGVRYQKNSQQWKLQANGKVLGYCDSLVLAHNGKCADRIMSQTPAKDLHQLLRVNFSPNVPAHGGQKMTLNSLYSMTMVLEKGSPLSKALKEPFLCGFSQHPKLRMISCQSRKYPNDNEDYEVWNVLSSAKFAKDYKAPQEFLPPDVVANVTQLLLGAVQESLGLAANSITPIEAPRIQLWGAAVPINTWSSPFLWDSDLQVGVCGDWLLESSVAGAWTSGRKLAKYLQNNSKDSKVPPTTGLKGEFQKSEAASRWGLASIPVGNQKSEALQTPR